jgi:ribosomal protein S18 acetylase RimI-like enzyme
MPSKPGAITIEELDPVGLARELEALAEVLRACVHAGASVSFVLPFGIEEARGFWTGKVRPALEAGGRRLLVARLDGRVAGTVQLDVATPPNQAHRADVSKLLVHPEAQRRGIARRLMLALESVAREEGRTLLTLDTRRGDAAEPLYASLGYALAGVIPRYARAPDMDRLDDTSVMYKQLAAA